MLQRHNDDTKDEETISYVDPQDKGNTDERNMILNTYGDTAGYVSSWNVNIGLILMYAGYKTFPYNICKVFKRCFDVFLGIEMGNMELKQTYIRSQSFDWRNW